MSLFFLAIAAGFLTVLAPCILPLLPLILGTTAGQSRLRPLLIVAGFIASFSLFGAFFATAGTFLGITNDTLRTAAVIILGLFGLALIFEGPYQMLTARLTAFFQRAGTRLSGLGKGQGAVEPLLVGASLGLLWTPCAGPILGTIITLAIQTKDPILTATLFAAYAVGAAIPMLGIAYGGQAVLARLRAMGTRSHVINRVLGALILVTAAAIATGVDKDIQTWLLQFYPADLFGL